MTFRIFFLLLFSVSFHVRSQPFSISEKHNIGNTAEIITSAGKWSFSLYKGGIIKTTFIPLNSGKNEQVSDAVTDKPVAARAAFLRSGKNTLLKWNDSVSVLFSDSSIQFQLCQSSVVLKNSFYSETERGFDFRLQQSERIFGTGERSVPLNRRGYKLPLRNNPWYGYTMNADALNYSVPFILSDKQYAILFDNPSTGYLDIGKSESDILRYSVCCGELSFYIIPADSYAGIFSKYKTLVGTQPLPPRWSMGNLMSRFGYTSESQTRSIFNRMKKDSIPFDAVIFDLFWFGDSIQQTLGNLEWINKKAWPDPGRMISDFKREHVKTILITEPFVVNTSQRFEESLPYQAADNNGKAFLMTDFYFGHGGLLDIFRNDTKDWFFSKYKKQMDIGVEGWWGDLGEPERHPAAMYHNLKDFGFDRTFGADEVHNIYGHYWSKMLYENYRKYYPDKRLFHLNRSGFAGTPRYSSFPWTGDVSRSWEGLQAQLPNIQGMSISGVPYVHSDAGGFSRAQADAELYVRWLQFAVFTPIFRPHGTALGNLSNEENNIPSEPSEWPEPTRSLAKQAAVQRYRWLPYNYNLSYNQTVYGQPLVKPLFFLNGKDSNLYKAVNQYLWGDQVMVVPVIEKGAKKMNYYIPEGKWTNLNDFMQLEGGRWYSDSNISLSNIPVYAREGSFIPLAEPMMHTDEYNSKTLDIYYFPSATTTSYDLFEDDGANPKSIQNRDFELTRFRAIGTKDSISIEISSNGGTYPGQAGQRKFNLKIPGLSAARKVLLNGKSITNIPFDKSINGISLPLLFQHKKLTIKIIK